MPRSRDVLRGLSSRITTAIPGSAREAGRMAKKPAIFGAAAFMGGSMLMRRRNSGLDKTSGRPTGMYKY